MIWRRLVHRSHLLVVASPCFRAISGIELRAALRTRLILNKHRRWVAPLITCEMFFSQCLQVEFFESTYLIRIFGSNLILSNNRSRATRWVLETCLKLGLLHFMIILIAASLSSKIYNFVPAFHDHLDCRFIVLKKLQLRSFMGIFRV